MYGGDSSPLDASQTMDVLAEFLENHHIQDMRRILLLDDATVHYSVNASFIELHNHHAEVAEHLLQRPQEFLSLFDEALQNAMVRNLTLSPMQSARHGSCYRYTHCTRTTMIDRRRVLCLVLRVRSDRLAASTLPR
eukprot:jgi/Mesvir1/17591/Mv08823-RA.1